MIEASTMSDSRIAGGARRVLPRYRADIRVRLALTTPLAVILHARAADVSTGGMSVFLPQESASVAVAMIGLKAPGRDDDVWLRVRLRHRSGFRCGFQFLEPTIEERALLRHLCRSLSS